METRYYWRIFWRVKSIRFTRNDDGYWVDGRMVEWEVWGRFKLPMVRCCCDAERCCQRRIFKSKSLRPQLRDAEELYLFFCKKFAWQHIGRADWICVASWIFLWQIWFSPSYLSFPANSSYNRSVPLEMDSICIMKKVYWVREEFISYPSWHCLLCSSALLFS